MSKISVTTIAGLTSGGDANKVKIESGDTLEVVTNATVGGTLGVTGATTATGGVTIPASTTVGLNFGSGTDLAQLAMQSAVADRIALRTTHTSTGDNNPFIIYQPSDAGIQNDALVINTSGQINMSKQPAFVVYGTQANPASGSVLLFNTEKFDIGNNYNNTNGRFTAPVAGIYVFYCTQIGPNRNSVFRYRTRLNGTAYPSSDAQMRLNPGAAIHDYGTSAIMIQMAASDYVDVLFNSDDGGTGHGSTTSGHEIFSGYLIG